MDHMPRSRKKIHLSSILAFETGIYSVKGWVKLESEPGSSRSLTLGMRLKGQQRNESSTLTKVATSPECWTKLETSFSVEEDAKNITLHIGGYEGLDSLLLARFFVSRVSISSWRKRQNKRISQIRMRAVTLKVRTSTGGSAKGATVKVSQISHSFTFGASVSGAITVSKNLRSWFASRFNMATFQNELKWQYTEPNQGSSNFKVADAMVSVLRALNIPIRGHSVFWDPIVNLQPWVLRLGDQDLKKAVARRMYNLVNRYKGKFVHWDVMNEALHGTYLDDKLNDKNFASSTFRVTRQIDPTSRLFINEYNVIEYYKDSGSLPAKVIEQLANINAGGGNVQGIGAQGHFGSVNPPLLRDALDKLVVAGIPVWLTEFDINQKNATLQADSFEAVMREAFSHPVVGGIIQWEVIRMPCSVWSVSLYGMNCNYPCHKCLANPDFTDRPIGKRYAALLNEWTTKFTSRADSSSQVNFRGFFGVYRADVTLNGRSYVRYFKVPPGRPRTQISIVL